MPRLLRWAAACHHLRLLLLFYIPPPARKKSARRPSARYPQPFLSKYRTYHTRSCNEHERKYSIDASIDIRRVPSSDSFSFFFDKSRYPLIPNPLQTKKKLKKRIKLRPESTIAVTMTAIQWIRVTMSLYERSTRWRAALDDGGASDLGMQEIITKRARFLRNTYTYSHNKPNWTNTWLAKLDANVHRKREKKKERKKERRRVQRERKRKRRKQQTL